MGQLQFFPDHFEVAHGGEKITFLPKEYALFQFLYEWKNHSFSREELLDRVWGMEEPTDRTVDDHIYRLRKKLLPWNDFLTIDTIRGYGYRLTFIETSKKRLPQNPDVTESVQRLFKAYHGLGMGDAMQMLSANQEILGVELEPFYSIYMHFVNGDFGWIVDTTSIPVWDKINYLLHLYWITESDPSKTLVFYERMLKKKELLSGNWGTELEINLVTLYVQTKKYCLAEEHLDIAEKEVAALHSSSYSLYLLFAKMYLALMKQESDVAKYWIDQAKEILSAHDHLRESGIFSIIHGLWLYQTGRKREARETVDIGFETLKKTKFVPHLLQGIRHLLFFLDQWNCDEEWKEKYRKYWHQFAAHYRLKQLEPKILQLLQLHL